MTEYPEVKPKPTSAVECHDLGISVIRLRDVRPGHPTTGKAPQGNWKPQQKVRITRHEAESIRGQYGNVTGALSGIVVIDVDDNDLLEEVIQRFADSPMRTKTAKGWHLYFRHPGVEIRNRAKLRKLPLDVRGDGGYVVGPGSLHWSGRRYEAQGDWSSIESLPVFDPSWLEEERKYKQSTIEVDPIESRLRVIRRAIAYVEKVEPAVSGQGGHNSMFRAVCKLLNPKPKGFGLTESEALPIIASYNARCLPPFSDKDVEHKIQSVVLKIRSSIGG